ncbi:MAG: hypothetical protein J0I08_22200, partial [Rhizobiales bacterium]|nr:hypothetical protein [Hyphomicrobiales bacterium]
SLYGWSSNTKIVVPAQAGTHTPQQFGSIGRGEFIHNNQRQGLWVPACAGTTPRMLMRQISFRVRISG